MSGQGHPAGLTDGKSGAFLGEANSTRCQARAEWDPWLELRLGGRGGEVKARRVRDQMREMDRESRRRKHGRRSYM